jgi:hypothetical protein
MRFNLPGPEVSILTTSRNAPLRSERGFCSDATFDPIVVPSPRKQGHREHPDAEATEDARQGLHNGCTREPETGDDPKTNTEDCQYKPRHRSRRNDERRAGHDNVDGSREPGRVATQDGLSESDRDHCLSDPVC